MIFFLLTITVLATPTETRTCIVDCARNQIGKPYVWGGNGPDGFDCAGLVYYCYTQCGYTFTERPQTFDLLELGEKKTKSELAYADLVFPNMGHVQIYSGNGNIIHSPCNGNPVEEKSFVQFWTARRLIAGDTTDEDTDGEYVVNVEGSAVVEADVLNVRSEANTSSEVVATYVYGETIPYDQLVTNSECTWLSYIGGSGLRRYVCGKTAAGDCYVTPCP